MPPTRSTHVQPSESSELRLIHALQHEAQFAADGLCTALDDLGLKGSRPLSLSAALRMAAALRIRRWEELELRQHLPTNLPAGEALFSEELSFWQAGTKPARAVDDQRPVLLAYLAAWLRFFAHSAVSELAVECVIVPHAPLSPEELETLADFLWNNRELIRSRRASEARRESA